jgi:hypothetical protein
VVETSRGARLVAKESVMQIPNNPNYLPLRFERTIEMLKRWDTLTDLDREESLAALNHDSKDAAQNYCNREPLKVARLA